MSAINGPSQATGAAPTDATDTDDAAQAAPDVTASASAEAPASAAGSAASAIGAHQTSWAARLWGHIEGGIDSVENKILAKEEPTNTSGFTPNAPPDPAVGALNIGETALARLGLMRPFKTYDKWVDDGKLMRGSEQSDSGWADLQKQGVKTVVNLRYEDNTEAKTQAALGMKNVWLPSYDQSLPTEAEVQQFLNVVKDPANQPVYVHCEQGVGRTGVMSAAWRMAADGWTADQAIAEAKTMGMNSSDQENYIRQLYADLQSGKLH